VSRNSRHAVALVKDLLMTWALETLNNARRARPTASEGPEPLPDGRGSERCPVFGVLPGHSRVIPGSLVNATPAGGSQFARRRPETGMLLQTAAVDNRRAGFHPAPQRRMPRDIAPDTQRDVSEPRP
jgi:hypothetical protein